MNNSRIQVSLKNGVYTKPSGETQSFTTDAFTSNRNIVLFVRDWYNGNLNAYAKMKLYVCKMYEGNTLTRNFVPCYRKSDNVIGLYDLVGEKFYTNSGSGTFKKGSDV